MSFSGASLHVCRGVVITVAMAALLFTPSGTAFAAAPGSPGTGFEIPISDLKTVKKKAPPKRTKKEAKKKKTVDGGEKKTSPETAEPTETFVSIKRPNPEPGGAPLTELLNQKPSLAIESLPETGNTKILHSPYSFVAAGKRTVINTVIDSPTDIQEVNCSVRTGDGTERTQVKMVKANGTQYTYTATLPGLLPKTSELSYFIYVIDTQGRVTRSKEFVTLVKSLPFVPGWQIEDSDGTLQKIPSSGQKPTINDIDRTTGLESGQIGGNNPHQPPAGSQRSPGDVRRNDAVGGGQ